MGTYEGALSQTGRAAGLIRSLVVYHAVPLRQRRLRRLYTNFAGPGDLTFDLGAHVGNRTRALAAQWRDERAHDPLFARVRWNRRIEVDTTTLDALIARFGAPAFIKIDVEDAEPQVLAGLSQPVRALSFEYLPHALGYALTCVARLRPLGPYRFNWSPGESYLLASDRWMRGDELVDALETAPAQRRSGDIYARLG